MGGGVCATLAIGGLLVGPSRHDVAEEFLKKSREIRVKIDKLVSPILEKMNLKPAERLEDLLNPYSIKYSQQSKDRLDPHKESLSAYYCRSPLTTEQLTAAQNIAFVPEEEIGEIEHEFQLHQEACLGSSRLAYSSPAWSQLGTLGLAVVCICALFKRCFNRG